MTSFVLMIFLFVVNFTSAEDSLFIKEVKNVETISHLAKDVACLIAKNRILPSEITVILDNDGTLNTCPTPPRDYSDETPLNPRGDAVEAVDWMIRVGINIIFSSAWWQKEDDDNLYGFKDTLSRLQRIGFGSYIDNPTETKQKIPGDPHLYKIMSAGRSISVRRSPNPKDDYYRQKAYAAYFFNQIIASQTKVILFADDSEGSMSQFVVDIQGFLAKNIPPNGKILYPQMKQIGLYTLSAQMEQPNHWERNLREINQIFLEFKQLPPRSQNAKRPRTDGPTNLEDSEFTRAKRPEVDFDDVTLHLFQKSFHSER